MSDSENKVKKARIIKKPKLVHCQWKSHMTAVLHLYWMNQLLCSQVLRFFLTNQFSFNLASVAGV